MQKVLGIVFAFLFIGVTCAQKEKEKMSRDVENMIRKGMAYLQRKANEAPAEERPLIMLALVKCHKALDPEGKISDPAIKKIAAEIVGYVVDGVYKPSGDLSRGRYEAGITAMALGAYGGSEYTSEIHAIAKWILDNQQRDGAWHYTGRAQDEGDNSMTQYGLLGLWEAHSLGFAVPIEAWDKCCYWLCTRQDSSSGGWSYWPKTPANLPGRMNQSDVSESMTAAACCSIYICKLRLPKYLTDVKKKGHRDLPLLVPVKEEEKEVEYKPITEAKLLEDSLGRANNWLTSKARFPAEGPKKVKHFFYYMYAMERVASLREEETKSKMSLGGEDWYASGCNALKALQKDDGSWEDDYGAVVNTAFSLLFLSRSTKQRLTELKLNFAGGTQIGGEGLPTPGNIAQSAMQRLSDRMDIVAPTPANDLLKAFDDPNSPLAAILADKKKENDTVNPKELLEKSKGNLNSIRSMTRHPNPLVRRLGVQALANTGDLTVAPVLIERLDDDDPSTYSLALTGLRMLSRRHDSFGLPRDNPSDEQRAEGKKRWTEWFENLRMEVDPSQQFDFQDPKPNKVGAKPAAGDAKPADAAAKPADAAAKPAEKEEKK